MASNINPTNPVEGVASTQSVRANFTSMKSEIEALQNAARGPTGDKGPAGDKGATGGAAGATAVIAPAPGPVNPPQGTLWINEVTGAIRFWDGSAWRAPVFS